MNPMRQFDLIIFIAVLAVLVGVLLPPRLKNLIIKALESLVERIIRSFRKRSLLDRIEAFINRVLDAINRRDSGIL